MIWISWRAVKNNFSAFCLNRTSWLEYFLFWLQVRFFTPLFTRLFKAKFVGAPRIVFIRRLYRVVFPTTN